MLKIINEEIIRSDNLITVICKEYGNHFAKSGKNIKELSYRLTVSSLEVLENTNRITETFLLKLSNYESTEGNTLLIIYGLLQSLFIGIDSLYSLSRGVTNQKWSVNINQNAILKQIKFIRNDVVGHPNYRLYANNDIGFCVINTDKITFTDFWYTSFTFEDNSEKQQQHHIDILEILVNYYQESNTILETIKKRLIIEHEKKNICCSYSVTDDVYELFMIKSNLDSSLLLLEKIRNTYIDRSNELVKDRDRFLWRCSLIEVLFSWKSNDEFKLEMIEYMLLGQIKKLHSMALMFDKDNNITFTKSAIPNQSLPKPLRNFYRFASKKHKQLTSLLNNLHDIVHPYFDASINKIKRYGYDNEDVKKLCDWLIELKENNETDKVFLLGSELKRFSKNNFKK